jgi:hypothetical protein
MFEEIKEHNGSEKQNIVDKHIVKVKQYLSEKTDEELKEILKQQNNPEFLTYHTVQELKLRKNERTKRYEKCIETANEVLAGRKIIQRLAPNEEKGRIAGGRRNVEASIILGRSRRTDRSSLSSQENAKSQQENVLKDYAKAVDILKDKNGNLYNIDLIVGLNTSDKGGKAKYLPFKITKRV